MAVRVNPVPKVLAVFRKQLYTLLVAVRVISRKGFILLTRKSSTSLVAVRVISSREFDLGNFIHKKGGGPRNPLSVEVPAKHHGRC